jgi:predicted dehydrogenase
MHAEIAIPALEAGKHVLVEKPIATRLEDGLRMAAVARRVDRKLMVGHIERFNPAVTRMAELIADARTRLQEALTDTFDEERARFDRLLPATGALPELAADLRAAAVAVRALPTAA